MFEKEHNFNEKIDLREVDEFGFVDLNESMASGRLPVSVPNSEVSFDAPAGSVLAPSQIAGVPRDVFDAMEMRDAGRAAIADAKAKAEAASAPAPEATE